MAEPGTSPALARRLEEAKQAAEAARAALLTAIAASWQSRTDEMTKAAVFGQPLVTDALSDEQLSTLKRDLRNAVSSGTSRIPTHFAAILDIDTLIKSALSGSSPVRVKLNGAYPSSPPEELVVEFYDTLAGAGYHMDGLKDRTGQSVNYSSTSFTADDVNLTAPAEQRRFEEAVTAVAQATRDIAAAESETAAERSARRWEAI